MNHLSSAYQCNGSDAGISAVALRGFSSGRRRSPRAFGLTQECTLTKKFLAIALYFVLTMLHTAMATAADIRPFISGSGSFRAIVIEGNIEPGDFETFIRIIKENQGKISGVHIFSPGGDFYEAMKIGRAMRALELSSQVPMRSQSDQPSCEGILGIKPNDPKNCTCASAGRGGSWAAGAR